MSKLYVVTAPESIRGIYEDWPSCQATVSGVRGARYQAVSSRQEAETLLTQGGVTLPPGRYVFIDGNAMGGVGIVFVHETASDRITQEIGTTVQEIFAQGPLPGLNTPEHVARALDDARNVLAEMAACYHALRLAPEDSAFTVIYDYRGIEAWLTGTWAARHPHIQMLLHACRRLRNEKRLAVRFQHQAAHRSTYAGRNDFVTFNQQADRLATLAGGRPTPSAARIATTGATASEE